VQTLWLRKELGQSLARSFFDATIIMFGSVTAFVGIAFLFVS
jgi:hypothetical protein